MGVTATEAARQKSLKTTREWKRKARLESRKFRQSEQKSNAKWKEFNTLCRMFVKSRPWEFAKFLQELQGQQVQQPQPNPIHPPSDIIRQLGLA